MFDAREDIAEMVAELIEAARPLKRGEILAHETIVGILGVQPHIHPWQLCLGKLKRRLEADRGITLWSEPGVGYKLCTIQEQLVIGGHIRQVRARRQVTRGIKSIDALAKAGLTLHQQRLRAAYHEGLRRTHKELTSQINSQVLMERPTPTLPRARSPVAS